MKTILKKLVSAKFTIFLIIGLFGLVLNLISFIGYNEFFSPTFSSFLAFSTAIVFNYFCHGRFLWQSHSPQIFLLQRFLKFYSGYSFSMVINVSVVYFFQDYFENILFLQVTGIALGSLLNFFISRLSFTGQIR